MSLKVVPFKSFGAVSYSPSIVTMDVSVAVCDISDYTFSQAYIFYVPLYLVAHVNFLLNEYDDDDDDD